MDYKYIEQLLDRYFEAETSLEEEQILRTFFSQEKIPAELEPWRALFTAESDQTLGDDFDARILDMTVHQTTEDAEAPKVKAQVITLTQRLAPLFKAAAVIAIILTIGGALQAPWDNSWNTPEDYAAIRQNLDSISIVSPIQAENISDTSIDSTQVLTSGIQPTN